MQFKESNYQSQQNFKQRYIIKSAIGRGAQALVKKAIDRESQTKVAIKVFKKSMMDFEAHQQAQNENIFLQSLDHPCILNQVDYFEDSEYVCIVTELMATNMNTFLS